MSTFPTTENTDEKFWVWPKDPCYATELYPEQIVPKDYFLGDKTLTISGKLTKDLVSLSSSIYLVDSSGTDLCGPRTYQIFN